MLGFWCKFNDGLCKPMVLTRSVLIYFFLFPYQQVIVRYRNFTLNLSLQVACNFILLVSDFPIFSMHIVDASMNLYPSLVHLI